MKIDRVKLIAEMARQNIGVKQLADKAGVSRVTISAVRCGKSCGHNTALHIARALGVDMTELLEVEDRESLSVYGG